MTTAPDADPEPGTARRRWWGSLRARIVLATTGLTALALICAGAVLYLLERERLETQIDDSLERTVAEVRALAETEIDPRTQAPYASAQDLLYQALQRFVPSANEGAFTIDSTGVLQYAELNALTPQEDIGLIDAIGEPWESGRVVLASAHTPVTTYRYVTVPIQVGTGPPAALVVAFDAQAELRSLTTTLRIYGAVALAAILLIAAVSWTIAGRILRPVALVSRTAREVSSGDLTRRVPVVGSDDLADLTRTVNAMLARLEGTLEAQRRFMYDVGHELRTPLTVVRGHLELMDAGDVADATATRELALDELDRMNRLVDDLATIARAERPDFVRAQPTDVAELLDTVLAKARGLGPRRWRLDALAEGTALLDRERVTQALLQLASNAVRYSAPDTHVAIGSAWEGAALRLWVRDEGIGIPPQEHDRVFDRFVSGRGAPADSTGLGLAIVASIASGHGGDVHLDSAPGLGTRVTITLPSAAIVDGAGSSGDRAAGRAAPTQEEE
ncbi:sensor histidine kinase [Serinibacter salmoneus]|uniref:histidine kinase n=1 Tax=Serinibacter salmoneus TaxID=556530 RepID=A0A2A9CWV7_9MICO|nr:HAMP domain-containing sensor histidine kinase [Serinibacter salmoneus]PFG18914.1 signal transduction histidine kinase [Serinibacter salmoneus]